MKSLVVTTLNFESYPVLLLCRLNYREVSDYLKLQGLKHRDMVSEIERLSILLEHTHSSKQKSIYVSSWDPSVFTDTSLDRPRQAEGNQKQQELFWDQVQWTRQQTECYNHMIYNRVHKNVQQLSTRLMYHLTLKYHDYVINCIL